MQLLNQSNPNITYTVAAFSIITTAFLIHHLSKIGRRPPGLPPGPPTIPILGNIHLLPAKLPHIQFQKWAQEYGPIYSLILGTQTWVILSDGAGVKNLLDKRSGIYSGRLDMYVGQHLASGGLRMLMMGNGDSRWRLTRKLFHQMMNANSAKNWEPYQVLESKQMLYDMLHTPKDFFDHLRRYAISITTSITFGTRILSIDYPEARQLFSGFEKFSILLQNPQTVLPDFFPILRRFSTFLRPHFSYAKSLHHEEKKLFLDMWLRAKARAQDGKGRLCLCTDLARIQKAEGISDDFASYISGTLFEAGSDTTSNQLYGFVQAMVCFPDVQKRAQNEIDRVVGEKRCPEMEDEMKMQYVRGCVKETLRWMPTAIMGSIPHAVTQDDTYQGYHIPKGAGVINNTYTIHMDPVRYPDPRKFDPDRYKDDFRNAADSAATPDASQRDHFGFGAGRRICAGIHVAERSLFLAISRMLWAFNFEPEIDSLGKKIIPDPEKLAEGFAAKPEEYQARIIPRSKERAEFVMKEWEDAKSTLLDGDMQWKVVPDSVLRERKS